MEKQIESIIRKAEERFRAKQQLTTLSLGIDTLKRLSQFPTSGYKESGMERISQSLFTGLPEHVVSLRVGEDRISRSPDVIEQVLEKERLEWTLPEVDQYAASVARTVGIRWTSKFPKGAR